jgi:hydrogenase nickel incorporation protein HypA/HybF
MHELSICRNIVAIVGDAANGCRVRRVTLDVGKLAGVSIEAVAFSFGIAAEGTALEGAALDIREIDGRARCADCGAEFRTETLFDACACGSRNVTLLAGEELNVKSMELEEAA